ncbi:hypothetical protein GCM10009855_17110 [Gordonia cholesterolivorans]|uniref:Secreted protein n=1 Tax=Gordonia cholesterolivorans TaxID=559625 RepID=A0ABN3HEU5_9ACTN
MAILALGFRQSIRWYTLLVPNSPQMVITYTTTATTAGALRCIAVPTISTTPTAAATKAAYVWMTPRSTGLTPAAGSAGLVGVEESVMKPTVP